MENHQNVKLKRQQLWLAHGGAKTIATKFGAHRLDSCSSLSLLTKTHYGTKTAYNMDKNTFYFLFRPYICILHRVKVYNSNSCTLTIVSS